MNIPIYDPSPEYNLRKEEIDEAIQTVLEHGQFILGPEVKEFERRAADYLGVKHAIGVNSGTDALVIALRALGIGAGDEVITTAMSFFATAESVSVVGATPVFADIDERTYNIDPGQIEAAITPKTKAIIPVHLFGLPANMAKLMELAERHDLNVIEDCAQSFGARYEGNCVGCGGTESGDGVRSKIKGKPTGSIGECGTFSFFPTKNLGGIGDGGLIVTDNDDVARKANMLRIHGAEKKYHNEMLGYNSRLDTIQAAVLGVKLQQIDASNAKRRKVAERYSKKLSGRDEIKIPEVSEGHVFHQFTIQLKQRDDLKRFLKEQGISTNIYFPVPQNELPVYRDKPRLPVAHKMAQQVLSLPMWPDLSEETQDAVTNAVNKFFE